MFLLGICSIFQMIFLPGFLVIKPLNIQGKIRIAIFSFALSLIINYCMVFLLVKLGLYTRNILFIIFGIEMLVLLIMIYPFLNQTIFTVNINSTFLRSYLRKTINEIKHNPYSLIQFICKFAIIALAAITILWYAKQFFTNIGQVFSSWDAVVSFNPFAIVWSENKLPNEDWWRYGQLITSNWSLTYVFTNSKVEFFAKSIMPLFSLYILLLMLDLSLQRKSIGHYLGIITTGILLKIFMGDYISAGYADIPVSFFIFLTTYCLITIYHANDLAIKKKVLLLGFAFSFGAISTKLIGQIIAFLYPLLAFLIILKDIKPMRPSEKFKIVAPIFVVLLFVAIVFVAHPQYIANEIGFVKDKIHQFRSAKVAFQVISTKIPAIYIFLFIIIPLFFSFFDRIYRLIMVTLACPFMCVWIFYNRPDDIYDMRYLAPAIPLIGLSVGIGIENMASLAQRAWQKSKGTHFTSTQTITENDETLLDNKTPQQKPFFRIKLFELMFFIAFFLVVPSLLYTRPFLVNRQISLQKLIGYRPINEMIYDYQQNNVLNGKIISNYQYLGYLPGLEKFYEFQVFKIFEEYNFHRKEPDVHYILIMYEPGWGVDQKIIDDINNRIRTGEYQLIEDKNSVLFVKIR